MENNSGASSDLAHIPTRFRVDLTLAGALRVHIWNTVRKLYSSLYYPVRYFHSVLLYMYLMKFTKNTFLVFPALRIYAIWGRNFALFVLVLLFNLVSFATNLVEVLFRWSKIRLTPRL